MTTPHAKSNAREGDGVAGLPPLPSAARTSLSWMGDTNPSHYYTAAQMHAYAISAIQAQQGAEPVAWIPVSERLPVPEVDVLCYGPNTLDPTLPWLMFVDWFGSKPDCGRGVTHWHPLPSAPATGAPR